MVWKLFKETLRAWHRDKGPLMGAALAFYGVLSLAPLLLIAVVITGWVFGPQAAQGELDTQLRGWLGDEGARVVEHLVADLNSRASDIFATTVSLFLILWCSSRIFWSLKNALNLIWKVPVQQELLWLRTILDHFLAFSMVLGTGFLLLLSVIFSTSLAAVGATMSNIFPRLIDSLQLINLVYIVASLVMTTVLFALIFRYLPDIRIPWKDVWVGALVTALLFSVGKLGIGYYLGRGFVGSTYGAAGSFVMLLLWVYYSAQIFFLGAEFTHIFAHRHNR